MRWAFWRRGKSRGSESEPREAGAGVVTTLPPVRRKRAWRSLPPLPLTIELSPPTSSPVLRAPVVASARPILRTVPLLHRRVRGASASASGHGLVGKAEGLTRVVSPVAAKTGYEMVPVAQDVGEPEIPVVSRLLPARPHAEIPRAVLMKATDEFVGEPQEPALAHRSSAEFDRILNRAGAEPPGAGGELSAAAAAAMLGMVATSDGFGSVVEQPPPEAVPGPSADRPRPLRRMTLAESRRRGLATPRAALGGESEEDQSQGGGEGEPAREDDEEGEPRPGTAIGTRDTSVAPTSDKPSVVEHVPQAPEQPRAYVVVPAGEDAEDAGPLSTAPAERHIESTVVKPAVIQPPATEPKPHAVLRPRSPTGQPSHPRFVTPEPSSGSLPGMTEEPSLSLTATTGEVQRGDQPAPITRMTPIVAAVSDIGEQPGAVGQDELRPLNEPWPETGPDGSASVEPVMPDGQAPPAHPHHHGYTPVAEPVHPAPRLPVVPPTEGELAGPTDVPDTGLWERTAESVLAAGSSTGLVYRAALDVLPPPVADYEEDSRTAAPEIFDHAVPGDMVATFRETYGLDVSSVVVRRGAAVSRRARRLGARAFTEAGITHLPDELGALEGREARALLAHEVVHAVRQATDGSSLPSEDTPEGLEHEASAQATERWFLGGEAGPPPLIHPEFPPAVPDARTDTARAFSPADAAASALQFAKEGVLTTIPGEASGASAIERRDDAMAAAPANRADAAPEMPGAGSSWFLPDQLRDELLSTVPDGRDPAGQPQPLTVPLADARTVDQALERLDRLEIALTALAEQQEQTAARGLNVLELERLAEQLYFRFRSTLRTELMIDRERSGRLADFN